MESFIIKIINYIGDSSIKKNLNKTPKRVAKVFKDIYNGYTKDYRNLMCNFKFIKLNMNIIYIKNIFFSSNCEHHMLLFFGNISIAYIPSNSIIGLSKIIGIVNLYSNRLQTQEKLTNQIVKFIKFILKPKAILINIKSKHMCMIIRGVKSICSNTYTILYFGIISISKKLSIEILNFINND